MYSVQSVGHLVGSGRYVAIVGLINLLVIRAVSKGIPTYRDGLVRPMRPQVPPLRTTPSQNEAVAFVNPVHARPSRPQGSLFKWRFIGFRVRVCTSYWTPCWIQD